MPSLAKNIRSGLIICLTLWPLLSFADSFAAQIRHAELVDNGRDFSLRAKIDYDLSPTAKEALHKGVPLTWRVQLEIRKTGWLWDSTLHKQNLPYQLRFHALLSQYEVRTPNDESEKFLSLNAALKFMSTPQAIKPMPTEWLAADHHYILALKCQFDRESLPVPLRPFSYLDAQWFLSSDWYLWPIQK